MSVVVQFAYTGAAQSWVVPVGVTSIRASLRGATAGSNRSGVLSGTGGEVTATVPVTPLDTLYLYIGGAGQTPSSTTGGVGGWNGGGGGGGTASLSYYAGGGGGGGSDIRAGGTALSNRIMVAGGGGASAAYSLGGSAGGLNGQAGVGTYAGGVGTQSAGGAVAPGSAGAGAGSAGQGGSAGTYGGTSNGPGGGGGGYYGGASGGWQSGTAGANSGAGSGGSSYVATSYYGGTLTNASNLQGTSNLTRPESGSPTHGLGWISYDLPAGSPSLVAPQQGTVLTLEDPLVLTWQYHHAEGQNHYASNLQYRLVGSGTWTSVPNAVVATGLDGATFSYVLSVATLRALAPGTYEWQVQSQSVQTSTTTFGVWSPSGQFVVPLLPATPVWTDPYLAKTVRDLPLTVSWTASAQVQYQVQQLNAAGYVVWDSGAVVTSAKFASLPLQRGIANGTLRLRTSTDGSNWSLWAVSSAITTVTFPKSGSVDLVGIELEVYSGITGDFIAYVPNRMAPTYLDELNGPGAGSFTLRFTDPLLTTNLNLIDFKNVVRVRIGNKYVGFWVIMTHTTTVVSSDEGSAHAIVVSGLGGYGAWFPDAVVYPESGRSRFGVLGPSLFGQVTTEYSVGAPTLPGDRAFGFASDSVVGHWYLPAFWKNSYVETRQDNTVTMVDNPSSGNPWVGGPVGWPSTAGSANWIWWRDGYAPNETNGVTFFRREFTLTGNLANYQFFMSADTAFTAYLDGTQILDHTVWSQTASTSFMTLAPGKHVLAVAASQQVPVQSTVFYTQPAGFLFALFKAGDPVTATAATLVMVSDADTLCVGFPGVPPSWTPGDILATLVAEARARGVTSFSLFDLGFTATLDSYGQPWITGGDQWTFKVGDPYSSVVDKLTQVVSDVWFDENLVLQAAPQRGVDRGQLTSVTSYEQLVSGQVANLFMYPLTAKYIGSWVANAGAGEVAPTLTQQQASTSIPTLFGARVLQAQWGSNPTGVAQSDFEDMSTLVRAGRTYCVSMYVYVPVGSAQVYLLTATSVAAFAQSPPNTVYGSWQRLSAVVTADIDGILEIGLVPTGATTSSQYCYVDGIMVTEGTALLPFFSGAGDTSINLWTDPEFLSGALAVLSNSSGTVVRRSSASTPGDWFPDAVGNSLVVASLNAVGSPNPKSTNLIVNGSFEHDVIGKAPWSWVSSASLSVDSSRSYSGANSLKIVGTGTSMYVRHFPDPSLIGSEYLGVVPVTAGVSYTFKMALRIDTALSTAATPLQVQWYSIANPTVLDGSTFISTSSISAVTGPTTGWQIFTLTATAPTGAQSAFVGLMAMGGGVVQPTDVAWVDAVMFGPNASSVAFFSGDTPTTSSDQYVWTGVPGQSASLDLDRTISTDTYGSYTGDAGFLRGGLLPGHYYYITALCHLSAPQLVSPLSPYARSIVCYYRIGAGSPVLAAMSTPAPNEEGTTLLSVYFQVPSNATEAYVRLYNGSSLNLDATFWAHPVISDHTYGSDAQSDKYLAPATAWLGAEGQSVSVRSVLTAPRFRFKMAQALPTTVSMSVYGLAKNPQVIVSEEEYVLIMPYSGDAPFDSLWQFDVPLQLPAQSLVGMAYTYHYLSTGSITLYPNSSTYCATAIGPNGGYAFEWWSSGEWDFQAWLYLTSAVLPVSNFAPNADGEIHLHMQASGYMDGLMNLDVQYYDVVSNNSNIERLATLPEDYSTAHYVLEVVQGQGGDFVLVYRNGQEILSMSIQSGFTPKGFLGFWGLSPYLGTTPALGEFAYYDRYMYPAEIVAHYQAGIGVFTSADPVVFQQAKNVLDAGSTVQFIAKTAMVTLSTSAYFENTAAPADLAKYGRIESYFDGSSKTPADARKVADQTIRSTLNSSAATLDFFGSYTPWEDFGVGDWVLAPGDYSTDLVRRRIASISCSEDPDSGRVVYAVELDTVSQTPDKRISNWLARALSTGNLQGLIANSG